MFSKTFFVLAVLASCVLAQDSTTSSPTAEPSSSVPGSVTPCILGCIQPAAAAVGCDFTDASCVCTNTEFQQQAKQCLEQQCTQDEVQTALGLQAQECGAIGATPSPSESVTESATSSKAASSSAEASVTTTSPRSSAAQSTTRVGSSVTAPVSKSSGAASTGTSASARPTNAAMGKGDGMGLMGLVVAGIFGLAL